MEEFEVQLAKRGLSDEAKVILTGCLGLSVHSGQSSLFILRSLLF